MKKSLKFFSRAMAMTTMFLSVFLFSSCGDDDEKEALIDITNPNVVAKSVVIENATYVATGNPPAQTISDTAPLLDETTDGEPLISIQGSKIIVNAELESGSASGFYVKVVGADGYYKVTSTTPTGRQGMFSKTKHNYFGKQGRTQEEDEAAFSIEVPDNIKPGEFCISYCVYDAQNQVSNVIVRCVTVTTLGGENSAFLSANDWEFIESRTYENNKLVATNYPDVPDTSSYWANIWCDSTGVAVKVSEEYTQDYSYIKYAPNGAMQVDTKYYEKYLDYDNSNCEPVYIENNETQTITGAWSYDSNAKIITMIYNVEFGGQVYTIGEKYDASIVGNNLVIKVIYSDIEYEVVTLKPKS
jgi:hypothetical protein